ncbi:3-phosphoshikimate 1-carboxyvinyltransferase [Bifidobacterium vespertilionis]|uniref:3-phosphoshikimate 1-carboxyvinyltransferase n=1 Tax=Bifidobacterium vespertilionis TaxID=2562524 RepID=UPI001BDCA5B7|nr:3-phosphoshikimate 1-carboxyvinyltransferase [Bifidobacterium vespertilionis]MBT1179928.1 3-phosphoshikimate 1-carboxyvinyltransferase [Bifidobacterium vespertilionis]
MVQQLIMRALRVDIREWFRQRFRPSSYGAAWVLVALAYFCFSYTLVYTFHMPRVLLYGDDALNCVIYILALTQRRKVSRSGGIIIWIMTLYCCMGVIGAILSAEKLTILLWGYRNIIRYFMFFYSCLVFLKKSDFIIVMRVVRVLFWVSVPLCTIERFMVTYPAGTIIGDKIGGVFWNFSGSNLPLNMLLCVYCIDVYSRYFTRKCSLLLFMMTSVAAIYMSATAELKVFLVELIIIVVFTAFGKGVSWRTIVALILGSSILSTASMYFIFLNAGNSTTYASNYSLQGYLDYATRDTGYTGSGDLNRFTGIGTVSEHIFHYNPLNMLFGIGLGNADYTNFFTSDFYSQYSGMHYQWFQGIWMFIESGYVGVSLYLLIFIMVIIHSRSMVDDYIKVFVCVMCIIMIVMFFYNITLRVEPTGYFSMLVISLPYLMHRAQRNVRRIV